MSNFGFLFGRTDGTGNVIVSEVIPAIPPAPGEGEFAAVIWRPGVPTSAPFVETWPEVQAVIAASFGCCNVYIDDSVAPALVPPGLTDCQGRTTFLAASMSVAPAPATLILQEGAILKDVYAFRKTLTVQSTATATPPIQMTGEILLFDEGASVNVTGAAPFTRITNPTGFVFIAALLGVTFTSAGGAIVDVPVGDTAALFMVNQSVTVTTGGGKIFSGAAGSFALLELDSSYFHNSSTYLLPTAGFGGTLTQDPIDHGQQYVVVYRPGLTSADIFVETWAEVQSAVFRSEGNVIVYVDDGTAPAHVPAASLVTDFEGRGELRAYRQDEANFSTLTVDNGATLKAFWRIAGTLEVLADTTGAMPAFDFDYSANVLGAAAPVLYVEDLASIGTTPACTQPACIVPAGATLSFQYRDQGGSFVQSAAPLIEVLAGATFFTFFVAAEMLGPGFGLIPATWVSGPGASFFEYDSSTILYSKGSPPQSSAAGPNFFVQTDTHEVVIDFTANAANVLAPFQGGIPQLPVTGMWPIEIQGYGSSGGSAGGQGGAGGAPGVGGGGSGGCNWQVAKFFHNLADPLNIVCPAGGAAGVGGAAGGGAGTDGVDGAPALAQDGTTNVILAALVGSSGGSGHTNGGASYAGSKIPKINDINAPAGSGFPGSGGPGGIGTLGGRPGQFAAGPSFGVPQPGTQVWQPGVGGTSAAAEGGGGGGGGAGPLGSGGAGGNGTAAAGLPGNAPAGANTGGGAGGGAGGATAADPGGNGAVGSAARVRMTLIVN